MMSSRFLLQLRLVTFALLDSAALRHRREVACLSDGVAHHSTESELAAYAGSVSGIFGRVPQHVGSTFSIKN